MKVEPKERDYNEYVDSVTPKVNSVRNCVWAFLVGGAICTIGQIALNILLKMGVKEDAAYAYVAILLVLCSIILTSLGIYKKIAKYGGAGALVPITGFANGVGSSLVEFQTEGEVFGKGVKAFTIAGPVILYGILTSWVLGLIYWIFTLVP
jgi:stage V sporulation protein AC